VDLELPTGRRLGSLEQVLDLVAGFCNLAEAHHPGRPFQCMQLAAKLCRWLSVTLHRRNELDDPLEAIGGLFEEEGEKFRILQISVQFRRLTSTPRVPTISPAGFETATAIVKHGSPVSKES